MIKNSISSMDSINKMMEDHKKEAALEDMIALDTDIKKLLHTMVEPKELEKVEHARRKRSHGVGYYDPDYQWLAKELNLQGQDQADLYRVQQQIHYGGKYTPNKYPATPQYAKASAEVPELLKDSQYLQESSYGSHPKSYKEGSTKPNNHHKYSQYQRAPTHHYSSYPKESHPTYHKSSSYNAEPPKNHYVSTHEEARANREESVVQKLLASLYPIRDSMPTELSAAYEGAKEVGKHVGSRLKPMMRDGYKTVAYDFYPRAKISVAKAVDSVPEDIKDFARQGKKIVETRAKYVSEIAKPSLNKIGADLWQLQEQLKQVAQETSVYAEREVVPNIVPALKGLLFDIQVR